MNMQLSAAELTQKHATAVRSQGNAKLCNHIAATTRHES